MFRLKTMRWKVLGAAAPLLLATMANTLAATIDLGNGARVVAFGSNSTSISGNPDGKSEIIAASLQLNADGQFELGSLVNVSRAAGDQFATSIAVNPTNPRNVVVAGVGAETRNGSSVLQDLILATSNDGGQTFSSRRLSAAGSLGKVVFGEGILYVSFVDRNLDPSSPTVRVFMSRDGGVSLTDLFEFPFGGTDYSLSAALSADKSGVQVSQFQGPNQIFVRGFLLFDPFVFGPSSSFSVINNAGPNHQLANGIDAVFIAYERPDANSVFPSPTPSCSVFIAADVDGAGGLLDYSAFAPVLAAHDTCSGVQLRVDRGTSATRGGIYVLTEAPVSGRKVPVFRFSDDSGSTWSSSVELKDSAGNPLALNSGIDVDAATGSIVVVNGFNVTTLAAPNPPTVTAAPSNLSATLSAAGDAITLKWSDNSSNEFGFVIEGSDDCTGFFLILANVAPNVTTFTQSNLTRNRKFCFQVRAQGRFGNSPPSNVASAMTTAVAVAAPRAPSNLTASGGSKSVTLRWRDNSSNETRFEIQRSTDGTTFASLRFTNANTTSFTDSGLPSGKRFFYRVRALNEPTTGGSAASGFTNTANAITRR